MSLHLFILKDVIKCPWAALSETSNVSEVMPKCIRISLYLNMYRISSFTHAHPCMLWTPPADSSFISEETPSEFMGGAFRQAPAAFDSLTPFSSKGGN